MRSKSRYHPRELNCHPGRADRATRDLDFYTVELGPGCSPPSRLGRDDKTGMNDNGRGIIRSWLACLGTGTP